MSGCARCARCMQVMLTQSLLPNPSNLPKLLIDGFMRCSLGRRTIGSNSICVVPAVRPPPRREIHQFHTRTQAPSTWLHLESWRYEMMHLTCIKA